MLIDYARVSADDQSLDLQLDSLRKAGGKRILGVSIPPLYRWLPASSR